MDYVTLAVIENYLEFKVSHHFSQFLKQDSTDFNLGLREKRRTFLCPALQYNNPNNNTGIFGFHVTSYI